MPYYEVTITVADTLKDRIIERISKEGCLGVIENDASLVAYFPQTCDIKTITDDLSLLNNLLERSGNAQGLTYACTVIPEQDWNESWKKGFQPVDAGKQFTIIPPWEQPRKDRINITIDPAMAFGTGHHETTRSCLLLMEKYAADCSQKSFLDLGTGTGILAIAAAKLGYRRVVGIDTDPLAVDASLLNIEINHTSEVEIREGSLSEAETAYDVIAANLISGVLVLLATILAAHLNPGGIAILSGILVGQEDEVIEAMEHAGLTLRETHIDDKWVSLVMDRAPVLE